ncbi:uncharacterized protein LOC142804298 [Rhipicephalus microplus]|uniref:uncharacterized protein LOC142804298 n=1 Tax=Rhipicephalus microplus TaxID=6941 RepID=UPI003F6C98D4
MPNKCYVPGCSSNYKTGKKVQVFSFPKDEAQRKPWLSAIPRKDFFLTENNKVLTMPSKLFLQFLMPGFIGPSTIPAPFHSGTSNLNPTTIAPDLAIALPLQTLSLDHTWTTPSRQTSSAATTTKQTPLSAPHCGLSSCANAQPNLFAFIRQVSNRSAFLAKKSSNYFLVQLPSPRCCVVIIVECAQVIRSFLLLVGDVETNPGPPTGEDLLTELQKLSAGQNKLISDMQEIKNQLKTTDVTITDLCKRITDLEKHCTALTSMCTELVDLKTLTNEMIHKICNLESRVDDSENRSRRNNFIFYGIPDTTKTETYSDSEEIIICHCSDTLQLTIPPSEIERAHRLGRFSENRIRPIIVKFQSFKTKELILSNSRKFKDTGFSAGEDFSPAVRHARKQLIDFARTKSTAFTVRFKTLFLGTKCYVFDETSQSVKKFK